MNYFGTFVKLRPLSLLRHLSSSSESTCLQVFSNSVCWSIYLDNGKITYATHSVEPFDRLERHLRRLSRQIPLLTTEIRVQLRLMFESDSRQYSSSDAKEEIIPPEYQAICWLLSQRYLDSTQAALVIQELVQEVIESYLLIKKGTYDFTDAINKIPRICRLDTEKITEFCQERLQAWQSLTPKIASPYQRPYLWIQSKAQSKNLPELQESLTSWMKGFSLRHLAVITNQDEVQLAISLHPHILNGSVLLHEPDPPFDTLPKFYDETPKTYVEVTIPKKASVNAVVSLTEPSTKPASVAISSPQSTTQSATPINPTEPETPRKLYKIVTVDDSPTVLREISRFLEEENFSVVAINNPVKAVMSIIRNKPDLILLDLNMEGIDGYELCKIVRNNSMFKNTPIIMVTGNKGLVDRVKARLVGASGYLTKPFTRADLLKIVFRHLT
jgi:twitching motility two-component system response regulator PilG